MEQRHNPRECWCGIDHSREASAAIRCDCGRKQVICTCQKADAALDPLRADLKAELAEILDLTTSKAVIGRTMERATRIASTVDALADLVHFADGAASKNGVSTQRGLHAALVKLGVRDE